MTPFDFLLLVLATYYLSWALVYGTIFAWLHNRTSLWGMLDCVYCTGFWVALFLWALWTFLTVIPIFILAIAGGQRFISEVAQIHISFSQETEHIHTQDSGEHLLDV